jgi:hypothetical protein
MRHRGDFLPGWLDSPTFFNTFKSRRWQSVTYSVRNRQVTGALHERRARVYGTQPHNEHTPLVRVADRVFEFIQNYLVVKCSYSTFQTWIMEVPADNLMTSDGFSGDVRPTFAVGYLGRSAANHIDARPRPRGTALGPVVTTSRVGQRSAIGRCE